MDLADLCAILAVCVTFLISLRLVLQRATAAASSLQSFGNIIATKMGDKTAAEQKKGAADKIKRSFAREKRAELEEEKAKAKQCRESQKRKKKSHAIFRPGESKSLYFRGPTQEQNNTQNFLALGGIAKKLPQFLQDISKEAFTSQDQFNIAMDRLTQNPFFTLMEGVNEHWIKFALFNKRQLRRSLAKITSFLSEDLLGLIYSEVMIAIEKKEKSVVASFASAFDVVEHPQILFGYVFIVLDHVGGIVRVQRATYSYRLFLIHENGKGERALQLALSAQAARDRRLNDESNASDSKYDSQSSNDENSASDGEAKVAREDARQEDLQD